MITRADVADLRVGDVVELRLGAWRVGTCLRGPVWRYSDGQMLVGDALLRYADGAPNNSVEASLTVVSRAPRPLYVNSDRTEPVPGDVVKAADGGQLMWVYRSTRVSDWHWLQVAADIHQPREELPTRLRLLVDGTTGRAVTS